MLSIGGMSLNQRIDQSWGAVNGGHDRFSVRSNKDQQYTNTGKNKSGSPAASGLAGVYNSSSADLKERRRTLMRDLKKKPEVYKADEKKEKVFEAVSDDKKYGFTNLNKTEEKKNEEIAEKPVSYNYKEVASKIQNAKTSEGAEQAVLSAKRKVLEIKRRISSGSGDAEELQLALTHAKRMEMVARKKKHHLELEELVVSTQSRDQRLKEQEDAMSDMRDAAISTAEVKIADAEDEILTERNDMIEEIVDEIKEEEIAMSEEELAQINEMISEFGEDQLDDLEDMMESLENMEIVDPHMSPEEFDRLKIKHRNSEERDIVKANMDYIKELIKQQVDNGGISPTLSTNKASDTAVAYAGPGAAMLSMTMTTPAIGAALDMMI